MKMYHQVVAVACALMLFTACASVKTGKTFNGLEITDSGSSVSHLNAKSSGLYLLTIPILTGDTETGGWMPTFMKDTVSVDEVGNMLTKKAKDQGATKVVGMNSSRRSLWIAPLLVFFWNGAEISGNAIK